MLARLANSKHWVFDMDGTLTCDVHDFAYVRRELGIPPTADIISYLNRLPAQEARSKQAWLVNYEREKAALTQPAEGAIELVQWLSEQHVQLAILTRNTRQMALSTLGAISLDSYFSSDMIIGRDQGPAKPDPAGLLHLAHYWQVTPQQLVMVGDYHFDLDCARAAGSLSVQVNNPDNRWPHLTDIFMPSCACLLKTLQEKLY